MFRSSLNLIAFCLAITLSGSSLAPGNDVPYASDNLPEASSNIQPATKPVAGQSDQKAAVQVFKLDGAQGPSILIGSATGSQSNDDGCEFKLEPLAIPDQFRVKLSIPDSVKIVELIPRQTGSRNRNVRVFMEQEPCDSGSTRSQTDATNSTNKLSLADLVVSRQFESNPYCTDPDLAPPKLAQQNLFYDPSLDANEFDPSAFQLGSVATKQFDDSSPFKSVLYSRPEISHAYPVRATIVGPRSLETGLDVEFEIVMANQSNLKFSNVLIQLQLPDGLETLRLSDSASLDEARRTVSWQIPNLAVGQSHVIRYSIKSSLPGPQRQKVVIAAQGLVRGEGEIETIVTPPFSPAKGSSLERQALFPSAVENK